MTSAQLAWMIAAALCLAGLPAAAQQQTGDAVADAARKARETKKDAPKPKKVYTDDDLKKSAPTPDAANPKATELRAVWYARSGWIRSPRKASRRRRHSALSASSNGVLRR